MRAVVQRVQSASVKVDGTIVGQVGRGLLVLIGVSQSDNAAAADYLAEKVSHLRIFQSHDGKMGHSVVDISGSVLAISQFTLYGDVRRGRRPDFAQAARPELARSLYERFVEQIRAAGIPCETGQFQQHMLVEIVNDGPVTILLDSDKTF